MAPKSTSRTLTDHDEIRRWAEDREAKPAVVRSTHDIESSGIIRLDFPGYSGAESLEEIEWDEWFEDFDQNKLALIVQDQTANGEQSNFNKLVSREETDDDSAEATMGKKAKRATKKAGGERSQPSAMSKGASASQKSKRAQTSSREQHTESRQQPRSHRRRVA
jgi:hypothetical protein